MRGWRHSPGRGRSQGGRDDRSEAESHGGHVYDNPLNTYPHDQPTQHQRHLDAASPPNLNRPAPSPRLRPDRVVRSNSDYSEPRIARRSNYSEPRAARRVYTSQSEHGHNTQSDGSPPPSPTPLRRGASQQPPQSLPNRQASGAHASGRTRGYRLTQNQPDHPPRPHSNDIDLGDIFDLDESLVQRRTPNCDSTIHRPTRGTQGSQGRWYFVCCGRKVGIFNEWCVCSLMQGVLSLPTDRNDVKDATAGVSGCHQQRVDNESLAYTYFKRALLSGKVEVTE